MSAFGLLRADFVVYFPSVVQLSNDTYRMTLRQDPGIIRINNTAVVRPF